MSKSGNYNMSEMEKRDAIIGELTIALQDAIEYISGEMDIIDGYYGVPSPNKAMQLTTEWEQVLAKTQLRKIK